MKKIITAGVVLTVLVLIAISRVSYRTPAGVCAMPGKVQYVDLVGRKVWIARDVRRIVLLRSKDIYLLAALLGDDLPTQLVAWGPDLKVDDAEVYRRLLARFHHLGEIAVTGDVYSDGLNVEQLTRIGADLIIADKFMLGRKFAERMESTGLPVVYLDGASDPLTGPQNGLCLLGKILDRQDRARTITDFMEAQVRVVVSRIASNAPPAPTVYLESGNLGPEGYCQCYGAIGKTRQQTSWGAILRALQVHNIAEDRVVGSAPISPEALLKADPQIIVITGQNWSRFKSPDAMQLGFNVAPADARQRLMGFTARPGWNLLSAVRNKKVYGVFHNTVSPTVFSGVQALAKDCYPDLFMDLDPEKCLKEFYDRFMPIAYDGTWMCTLE